MQRTASDPSDAGGEPPKHDPYAALRYRDFRLYLVGHMISVLGLQMQTVAVLWEIYERTGQALALALVGLVQVIPVVALALHAGHAADRFNRKRVVMTSLGVVALASLGLALISSRPWVEGSLWQIMPIYGCLLANGMARAFMQPAKSSLLPLIVPRPVFPNAVTWSMSGFQLAAVLGPALGGFLIAMFRNPAIVYLLDAGAALCFAALLSQIKRVHRATGNDEPATVRAAAAGLAFVWRNQVLLGAMVLDLFAVLLGGATTLLPIYAKDILAVGPTGLGWLQSAPAVGALLMTFVVAHRPPMQRAGRGLLLAVSGFGCATIVFGLSRSFWLSLAMLFLTGAFDTISVVVRHTLVQVLTPDEKRGRVSAVNSMFIGASNELGGFESGVVAQLFGPTISVVAGGLGTLAVVGLVAALWPKLRRFGRLDSATPEPPHVLQPAVATASAVEPRK